MSYNTFTGVFFFEYTEALEGFSVSRTLKDCMRNIPKTIFSKCHKIQESPL